MLPELYFFSWSIPTYFLILSLDFSVLFLVLRKRVSLYQKNFKTGLDVGIIGSTAGFLGARLFHVFYEAPAFYLNSPLSFFKVWYGGFVVLPGLLVGILVGLLWLWHKKEDLRVWLDIFAPLFAFGYFVGRWACFLQGCCYGRHTDHWTGLQFAIPLALGDSLPRWPTQLFASLGEGVLLLLLLIVERSLRKEPNLTYKKAGLLFEIWLIGHGINRMLMETLRDDERGPLLVGWGVSFWIALLVFALGLGAVGRRWWGTFKR